jgi:hypothetical protein
MSPDMSNIIYNLLAVDNNYIIASLSGDDHTFTTIVAEALSFNSLFK